MKIAKNYKNIIQQIKNSLKSGFPISCIGMFDSGVDYLFGLINLGDYLKSDFTVIPIDLSNKGDSFTDTLKAVDAGFSIQIKRHKAILSLDDAWINLNKLAKKKTVLFLFYFGYKDRLNEEFFEAFLQWRFLLGTKINWVICATYGLINTIPRKNHIYDGYVIMLMR